MSKQVQTIQQITQYGNLKVGFIPLDIVNAAIIAANVIQNTTEGGRPDGNTAPILQRINSATDKALRLTWAAASVAELQFPPVAMPPDLDHDRARRGASGLRARTRTRTRSPSTCRRSSAWATRSAAQRLRPSRRPARSTRRRSPPPTLRRIPRCSTSRWCRPRTPVTLSTSTPPGSSTRGRRNSNGGRSVCRAQQGVPQILRYGGVLSAGHRRAVLRQGDRDEGLRRGASSRGTVRTSVCRSGRLRDALRTTGTWRSSTA